MFYLVAHSSVRVNTSIAVYLVFYIYNTHMSTDIYYQAYCFIPVLVDVYSPWHGIRQERD